jgi:hypothetical protein
VKFLAGITVAVFMVVILSVGGVENAREKRQTITVTQLTWDQFLNLICQGNPLAAYISICSAYSSSTSTSTTSTTVEYQTSTSPSNTDTNGDGVTTSTTAATSTTTQSPSALQRAHWCNFGNGTYISLGYVFMYNECSLCQCTQSHAISCTTLQCMTTYCIDNSSPSTRSGQCCSQCGYEPAPVSCVINGITFPDGTVLKSTSSGLTCWCEMGNIECRQITTSVYSSLDYWGPGTAVYVIIVIICVFLLVGTLLCSCGGFLFYYYYKHNQQSMQQAYEHYYNTAGWQPMGEDGEFDPNAEAKKAEAEENEFEHEYPTGLSEQYIPPPYALYNGVYVNEQNETEQK